MAREQMPSEVTPEVGWFDRFAGWATSVVSRAWFFTACVLLVVVWAPTYFIIGNLDTYQLIINTATTIITFLLVALIQNAQERENKASQHKLNAMAGALADLMAAHPDMDPRHERELRAAVGLEERESS